MALVYIILRILASLMLLLAYATAFFRFKQGNYLIDQAVAATVVLVLVTIVFVADWIRSRRRQESEEF